MIKMNVKAVLALTLFCLFVSSVFAEDPTRRKVQSLRQKNIEAFEGFQSLFEQGKYPQLFKALDSFIDTDLNTIERAYAYNYYANSFFKQKKYQSAIEAFEKSIEVEDGLPLTFVNQIRKTVLSPLVEKYEANTEDYTRLKHLLDEKHSSPLTDDHLRLAESAAWFGKDEEFHVLIQRAEKSSPNAELPKEWFNLNTDFMVAAEPEISEKVALRKAQIERYPSRDAWLELIDLYVSQKRGNIQDLRFNPFTTPKIDPRVLDALDQAYSAGFLETSNDHLLYFIYLKYAKRYDEFVDFFQKSLDQEIVVSSTNSIKMYLNVLIETERWAAAAEQYESLIDLEPENKVLYQKHLAAAYTKSNQFDRARAIYTQLLKLKSEKRVAKKELRALKKLERQANKKINGN